MSSISGKYHCYRCSSLIKDKLTWFIIDGIDRPMHHKCALLTQSELGW